MIYFTAACTIDGQYLTFELRDVEPWEHAAWLDNDNAKNRTMSRTNVKKIRDAMERASFPFNGDTLCFDTTGSYQDGQHRSQAAVEADKTLPFLIIRGFAPPVVTTMDQGKVRSVPDILASEGFRTKNATIMGATAAIMLLGYPTLGKDGTDRPHQAQYVVENFDKLDDIVGWAKHVSARSPIVDIRAMARQPHIMSPAPLAGLSLVMENQGADRVTIRHFFEAIADVQTITDLNKAEIVRATRNWLGKSHPLIREGGTQFPAMIRVYGSLIIVYNTFTDPGNDSLSTLQTRNKIIKQLRLLQHSPKSFEDRKFPQVRI
jgi:hypothetical protein